MRQRAQTMLEFGLIVAAVALVGMLGLQVVTAAQKVYFGDVGATLAPPAAAVPGDVLHTVSLSLICNPAPIKVGDTTTCIVQVSDVHAGPSTPQGSVKTNISSGPPPSDCSPLLTISGSASSCFFTFTPTRSQFGQLIFDITYTAKNSNHLGQEQTFPITVIGISTLDVTCTNNVVAPLGGRVELGHPLACIAHLSAGSGGLQNESVTWSMGSPSVGPGTFTCSTTDALGSCGETGGKTSATCTTDSNGGCGVIFRPGGLNVGVDTLHVAFGGDTTYLPSSKDPALTVVAAQVPHRTNTQLSCALVDKDDDDHAHCTVQVNDVDPLPPGADQYDRSSPAGTVSVVVPQGFDPSQIDSTTNTCAQGLTQFAPDYATCTFDFNKQSGGGDHPTIAAQYNGDVVAHASSTSATVTLDVD